MKLKEPPVSAFTVYSEKFKQKKKKKPVVGGINKPIRPAKKSSKFNEQEMKEIENILVALAKRTVSPKSQAVKNVSHEKNLKNDDGSKSKRERGKVEKIMKTMQEIEGKNNKNDKGVKRPKHNKASLKNGNERIQSKIKKTDKSGPTNKPCAKLTNETYNDNTFKETDDQINSSGDNEISGLQKNISKTTKISHKIKITNNKSLEKSNGKLIKSKKRVGDQIISLNAEARTGVVEMANKEDSSQKKKKLKQKKSKTDAALENTHKPPVTKQTQAESRTLSAANLFEWLIQPIPHREFMENYWEKQPLLIQRGVNRNYFSELLSTPAIDAMLRENQLYFTKHLDVTSYTNGVRETHNLSGRAQANVVWDFYVNGCSVRLLNPQAFVPRIHALSATLQEYFGCFVGANVYLTPPNSQGFAPHYDDIEAFVLQIEGKKHWKVYSPRNDEETLPRLSSRNFAQEEVGKPFLDVTLEPGDLLYFPRGYIHQAETVEGEHSLHVTLSAYQKTAWVDLFEKALPIALRKAAAEEVDLRCGLPRGYLNIENGPDADKASFMQTAERLMGRVSCLLSQSLGSAVDQLGAQFMHDALPPVFTAEERQHSSLGAGLKMNGNGSLEGRVEIELDTQVRLIRANVCRLVEDEGEGEVRLYHCLDNPLEYHAEEPQFLVLPPEGVPVLTCLARSHPQYLAVDALPHDDDEALLALVSDLWDAGLLMARGLQPRSDDD